MKAIAMITFVAALGVGLACDDASSPPAAPPSLDASQAELVALLPRATIAAAELRDVAERWDELRSITRLAHLQDRLLEELQLGVDDLRELAGRRAVLTVVFDEAGRVLVPIAVFDAPSSPAAIENLRRVERLFVVEARGAVWLGPETHSQFVERVAEGDGSSLPEWVDRSEAERRLPDGGLVRAVVHLGALREYVGMRAIRETSSLKGRLAALLEADLQALETMVFRRDIVDGEIVTDVWIGIDAEVVPSEISAALATHRGPAELPGDLPPDILVAWSFPLEAEAGLAWLRTLGQRDPEGPLRNLDFWIGEFEARSGRDFERDVILSLGERGLALVFEGGHDRPFDFVAILDAREPERLEASLVDLRDWLADQLLGRSLGLAIPKPWDTVEEEGSLHGLAVWSPFGNLDGPLFRLVADRLVIATSSASLERGAAHAREADRWSTPAWAVLGDGPPDEIVLIRGAALARFLAPLFTRSGPLGQPLFEALSAFMAGAGDGRVVVRYEEAGMRVSARLPIDG